jgi:hypothetical protein
MTSSVRGKPPQHSQGDRWRAGCLEIGHVRFGGRPHGKGPVHRQEPRRAAHPTQAAKGGVGLNHYQVRHYTSWHRHITLAILALAILAAIAATAPPPTRTGGQQTSGPDTIALTVNEIRHLLGVLVLARPRRPVEYILHWSTWRRHHQAQARQSHYQRRLNTP